MTRYFINQFEVWSDLPLPCDEECVPSKNVTRPRLEISYGGSRCEIVSRARWIAQRPWSRCYDVGDGVLVSGLQNFQVHVTEEGDKITLFYDPDDVVGRGLAIACAINLGMAACSLRRGELPLHAASAEIDGRLIGVAAPSGTGKTTLLWNLLDHGALLGADDMTVAKPTQSGAMAQPSVSQHAKLSRVAMNARGLSINVEDETFHGSEEFWVPIGLQKRLLEPRPLAALFVLRPVEYLATTGQIAVQRVIDGQGISLLWDNMQGLWAGVGSQHARQVAFGCAALTQIMPFYVLEYYRCYEILPHLVKLMRELSAPSK